MSLRLCFSIKATKKNLKHARNYCHLIKMSFMFLFTFSIYSYWAVLRLILDHTHGKKALSPYANQPVDHFPTRRSQQTS